ncbi:hypothetical protein BU204_19560 [Actinophytocola xanthii]|uniref:Pentapeptide repeat-containing protein n=1 Tax=Actinophytocola xanthii TaxID=1912961 RepID=A0A1Q8CNJ9_9PSEU|nr:hypothetical protein BU204_19560 [Actinophytocola xanthii]
MVVPAGAGLVLSGVLVSAGGWVDWGEVARWVWPRGWWLLGWGLTVALLVVAVVRSVRRTDRQQAVTYTVLSPRAILTWSVGIVLVGVGVVVWLLLAYTGGDHTANRVQLDAIRTAGTIVVGAGGAAALLLAARRQRSAEIALKQKDRDQADVARAHALQERVAEQTRLHQERVAAATEKDAEARRITDLYTKAADQLGSEKAPVRLAGLYALERVAQDHPEQRQSIVNVVCAYLRMPYSPPPDNEDGSQQNHRERVQEREVRLTAQRILTEHLSPGPGPEVAATFWEKINLDLTGATLTNLSLIDCAVQTATFESATFLGHAGFYAATFTGFATFAEATFSGPATFAEGTFAGPANFRAATFAGPATFASATFIDYAAFHAATFTDDATFYAATFTDHADFAEATFTGDIMFGSATFTDYADFRHVTCTARADFGSTTFSDDADFAETAFTGGVPEEVRRYRSDRDH